MTAQLAPSPIFRSFDAFGFPLYLGQLGTFIAGTNTPQATYKDSTMGAANTNPVILNPRGECNLWLDPAKAYKLVLSDALGNLIWTVDNVTIGNANPSYSIIPTVDNLFNLGSATFSFANLFAKTNVFVGPNLTPIFDATSGNIGFYARTAQEIAAGVTPTNFSYPDGNVLRYGADITGVADSAYAFQQASFSAYAGWNAVSPTLQTRVITVPGGRYKFAGVNTPYGTPTVFVRAGMSLTGIGQGTLLDLSAWGASAANVFQLGWGFISGVATQDPGGQPPEMQNCFILGGPSGGGAAVAMWFNGGFVHDIWFSASGLAINLRGGYVYDCEIDIGLTGMVISGGINQTVSNVRFFNQNVAISFDASLGDFSDCVFSTLTIEYPKVVGIQFGSGAGNIKGMKFIGCDFISNASYATFSAHVSNALANSQIEFDNCTFHNWGSTTSPQVPAYAVIQAAAGSVMDFIGCIFDGLKTNSSYTQSTTHAGAALVQGTLRFTACQFRNLAATFGFGVSLSGSAANILHMSGCTYANSGQGAFTITAISKAASAVVTTNSGLLANPFVVGGCISFTGVGGMTEINGVWGLITAIGGSSTAWTATVAINSTAFSVFTSGGTALLSVPFVNITNANSNAQVYLEGIKGDHLQPLVNPQAQFQPQIRNCTDWFGPIGQISTVNYVLLPYGPATLWQVSLVANQNAGGSGSYRKGRLDSIEKDNDFAASAKSFLVQATAVQGAANTNPLLSMTAEFNQPGGGASIASSNSGCVAISWPNTYSLVSVDAQQVLSG